MNLFALASVLMLAAVPAVAQDAPGRTPIAEAAPQSDAHLPRVAIETSAGTIVVALDTERAPVTANNFLAYVDQHKLDGVTFYRTVKVQDRFGFVQFGVNGDPRLILAPIRHEPTSETGVHHLSGTLSIARPEPGRSEASSVGKRGVM